MIALAVCLVFFAAAWIVPASAADLNRCAAIADDGRRLACYDGLARPNSARFTISAGRSREYPG